MVAFVSKLKQSSLYSFFPEPNAVPDYQTMSVFARKISAGTKTHPSSKPDAKSKAQKKIVPEHSVPLRRSTRKRPASSMLTTTEGEREDAQDGEESTREDTQVEDVEYTDSPVFQYTCDKSYAEDNPFPTSSSYSISSLTAFKMVGKSLYDPSPTKIYAVDVCYPKGTEANKVLVAAGGHGGFISVYGTSVEEESIEDEDDGSETEVCSPLMGWKSSNS